MRLSAKVFTKADYSPIQGLHFTSKYVLNELFYWILKNAELPIKCNFTSENRAFFIRMRLMSLHMVTKQRKKFWLKFLLIWFLKIPERFFIKKWFWATLCMSSIRHLSNLHIKLYIYYYNVRTLYMIRTICILVWE